MYLLLEKKQSTLNLRILELIVQGYYGELVNHTNGHTVKSPDR
jgi:hypothetical protein